MEQTLNIYIGEISTTRCNNCVFIRNGFTLYVSGDNLTHHQEYNAARRTTQNNKTEIT